MFMHNHLVLTEQHLVLLILHLLPVHPVAILPGPVSGFPGLWNILKLKIICNIFSKKEFQDYPESVHVYIIPNVPNPSPLY